MSKFTKGPYRVAHNASAICAGESMTLARVYWSEGRSEEENRANADLFAAAPEMLAVLKRAVDDQRLVEVRQGMIEWYDDAVAAIAKAGATP